MPHAPRSFKVRCAAPQQPAMPAHHVPSPSTGILSLLASATVVVDAIPVCDVPVCACAPPYSYTSFS